MPFSGDCHVVSCARDGQVRLAELSLTGVCKGTKKLAQHKGAAHKVNNSSSTCFVKDDRKKNNNSTAIKREKNSL